MKFSQNTTPGAFKQKAEKSHMIFDNPLYSL